MVDRRENLVTSAWKEIELDGKLYLVKNCFFPSQGYEFLICDLDRVWHESCTNQEIGTRFKELNPSYEVPPSRITQFIKQNLQIISSENSSDSRSVEVQNDGKVLTLSQESMLAGLQMKWQFCCLYDQGDLRKDLLVVPLLVMVSQLQRRQQHLYSLLQRKDREIEEYKSTGAKLSRRSLLTKPFEKEEFDKAMNLSKGFEREVESGGRNALTCEGQNLYQSIMATGIRLKGREESDLGAEPIVNSLSPIKSGLSSLVSSPGKSPGKVPVSGSSQEPNPEQEVAEKNLELTRRQQLAEKHQKKPPKKKKKKLF